MKNKLLEEYDNQLYDLLTEKEIKSYINYNFYSVYEVTIGGYESSGGDCCGCCCGIFICINCLIGAETGSCCFGGL